MLQIYGYGHMVTKLTCGYNNNKHLETISSRIGFSTYPSMAKNHLLTLHWHSGVIFSAICHAWCNLFSNWTTWWSFAIDQLADRNWISVNSFVDFKKWFVSIQVYCCTNGSNCLSREFLYNAQTAYTGQDMHIFCVDTQIFSSSWHLKQFNFQVRRISLVQQLLCSDYKTLMIYLQSG